MRFVDRPICKFVRRQLGGICTPAVYLIASQLGYVGSWPFRTRHRCRTRRSRSCLALAASWSVLLGCDTRSIGDGLATTRSAAALARTDIVRTVRDSHANLLLSDY